MPLYVCTVYLWPVTKLLDGLKLAVLTGVEPKQFARTAPAALLHVQVPLTVLKLALSYTVQGLGLPLPDHSVGSLKVTRTAPVCETVAGTVPPGPCQSRALTESALVKCLALICAAVYWATFWAESTMVTLGVQMPGSLHLGMTTLN